MITLQQVHDGDRGGPTRTRSLVWLERRAHNAVVAGSNPAGSTFCIETASKQMLLVVA